MEIHRLLLVSVFLVSVVVQCQWANDVSRMEAEPISANLTKKPFTDECLNCICETINCTAANSKCKGDICGRFSIDRANWKDAGHPTVLFDDVESDGAFERCANDFECARLTIKKYMDTHPHDCNNDSIIDCYDYGAIHFSGTFKCKSPMSQAIGATFSTCLSKMKN
uniref:lysozyme n=1 Tax=Nilaparvata lugens TaxID=108931 RepID=N0A0R2_NILLU|nr:i-type lysozyme 5 [Nilaparvata lugens]